MRVAFLTVALWLAPAAVLAHGEAQWIADGKYTGDDGVQCCGPTDCERAPVDAIHRVPGGWMLPDGQVFQDGQPGFYESEDLSWWWCRAGEDHHRCLFRAQSAT